MILVSLFRDSKGDIAFTDEPVFGVQYLPKTSPGPRGGFYLFEKLVSGLEPLGD